jgi:hypothetical protein
MLRGPGLGAQLARDPIFSLGFLDIFQFLRSLFPVLFGEVLRVPWISRSRKSQLPRSIVRGLARGYTFLMLGHLTLNVGRPPKKHGDQPRGSLAILF